MKISLHGLTVDFNCFVATMDEFECVLSTVDDSILD